MAYPSWSSALPRRTPDQSCLIEVVSKSVQTLVAETRRRRRAWTLSSSGTSWSRETAFQPRPPASRCSRIYRLLRQRLSEPEGHISDGQGRRLLPFVFRTLIRAASSGPVHRQARSSMRVLRGEPRIAPASERIEPDVGCPSSRELGRGSCHFRGCPHPGGCAPHRHHLGSREIGAPFSFSLNWARSALIRSTGVSPEPFR